MCNKHSEAQRPDICQMVMFIKQKVDILKNLVPTLEGAFIRMVLFVAN